MEILWAWLLNTRNGNNGKEFRLDALAYFLIDAVYTFVFYSLAFTLFVFELYQHVYKMFAKISLTMENKGKKEPQQRVVHLLPLSWQLQSIHNFFFTWSFVIFILITYYTDSEKCFNVIPHSFLHCCQYVSEVMSGI